MLLQAQAQVREKFWQKHGHINIECKARQADISQETHSSLHPAAKTHADQREKEQRTPQTIPVHARALGVMHVYICILDSLLFSAYKCVQSKAALT